MAAGESQAEIRRQAAAARYIAVDTEKMSKTAARAKKVVMIWIRNRSKSWGITCYDVKARGAWADRAIQKVLRRSMSAAHEHPEYQARDLFEEFGVATAKGAMATTPDEAQATARGLEGKGVVKAQVHAAGGEGDFKNGFRGGVRGRFARTGRVCRQQMLGRRGHEAPALMANSLAKVLVAEAMRSRASSILRSCRSREQRAGDHREHRRRDGHRGG